MRALFLTALLLAISLPLYAVDNEALHKSTPSINEDSEVVKSLPDTPSTAESSGKVYKWVDDQGLTHYGDEPPSKDMAPIDLPTIKIIDSAEMKTQESPTPEAVPTTRDTTPPITNYQLDITSPKNDETIAMSNSDTVFVALSINVPLLESHHISMSVDGQEIAIDSSGAVNIPVSQGNHTVQASIVDDDKNVFAQSSIVKFKAINMQNYNQSTRATKLPITLPPDILPTDEPLPKKSKII